ncbi:MAG: hypothetical protein IPN62_16305 [Flavobacteriales bacterium]|nr:hypothetical protein [Flavobacteriales bacterium]
MSGATDEHLAKVLERLGEVARALRWKQATEAGISALQLRILGVLAEHPERQMGVALLAEELQVGKPTVSESEGAGGSGGTDGRHLRARGPAVRAARPGACRAARMLLLPVQFSKHWSGSRGSVLDRKHTAPDTLHHCALLKKDLVVQELRTDCSEHEQAAERRVQIMGVCYWTPKCPKPDTGNSGTSGTGQSSGQASSAARVEDDGRCSRGGSARLVSAR